MNLSYVSGMTFYDKKNRLRSSNRNEGGLEFKHKNLLLFDVQIELYPAVLLTASRIHVGSNRFRFAEARMRDTI